MKYFYGISMLLCLNSFRDIFSTFYDPPFKFFLQIFLRTVTPCAAMTRMRMAPDWIWRSGLAPCCLGGVAYRREGEGGPPSPANSCWSWRRSFTAISISVSQRGHILPTTSVFLRSRSRSGSRTGGQSVSVSRLV